MVNSATLPRAPAPVDWPDDREHRRKLAQVLNQVLDGKINACGQVTFTPSSTTTAVNDARIGEQSVISMQPATANAAAAMTDWHVNARGKGTLTLTHSSNAQTDRTFDYIVLG